jgi:hypothetical protein
MVEQCRLIATFVVVTPLVSSLSTRGKENYTFHPWSTWDVLREHVKVVAHVVGRICCSGGVPLGDLEERVASPKVFALQPMALSSSSNVSTKETWELLIGPKLIGGERRHLM